MRLPFVGSRHKYVVLVVVLLICLGRGLLSLKSTDNDTEDRPRFLYHSRFRTNPDTDYELRLSNALRDLEHRERSLNGLGGHTDTLWQILLGKTPTPEQRGEDSLNLEAANAEWKYKIVTSEWAEEFVTITLSSIPGLASMYHSYPHNVLRSDLLRYLILWYYGGYYADMDVFPKRTIKSCPSLQHSVFAPEHTNVSLVVGIEIDEPFASPQKMRNWHWVRSYGFIQYTMYAPHRFSPLLREVIVRVLSHTKSNKSIIFRKYSEMTTLEVTGPGVFTDAILDCLSETLPATHPLISDSVKADEHLGDLVPPGVESPIQRVSWAPFYRLNQPLCVDDSNVKPDKQFGGLCVLPVNAWGNGQRHSGSEGFNSQQACINHRFSGTWKPWRQSWKKYLFG
ncbi:hypothetical protein N7495_002036 [Penicillium taxi]|uniref:uncharacterized protein n=1 Tax=Penicillium taxi TaxID=168475 RepID=UPI002545199C|nr:uncharacterized protein N7495_002036 [Penicillium taxi]KAJ5901508.1 hypothetical protein N7495_002036 [Penicillium taxi]